MELTEWDKLREYLYANAGKILAARGTFILATNVEPTVLILPPSMAPVVHASGITSWYNMAVICGDVEEPTIGFGVSQLNA